MFDSALDRLLTYRLSSAYDCWGNRRELKHGARNGIWFLDAGSFDEPALQTPCSNGHPTREEAMALLRSSGRFTIIELATLDALVVDKLSIGEIAERHGCTRQAVVARLVGNSKGQGGILKKAQALLRP